MALLDSSTFSYDGVDLKSLGMRFGWIGEPENETMTGLNRTILETELNAVRSRPLQYATVYEGCLEFSFIIFKTDGTDISYQDSHTLNQWLSGSTVHKKLTFPGEQDVYYMAICTQITDQIYNGHIGKGIVFRCDAPYAYHNPIRKKITVSENRRIKIYNDSDEGVYYPNLKITGNSDLVIIRNLDDKDREMRLAFSDLTDKTICMDCEKMRVVDENNVLIPVYKIGWDVSDYIYWFRLLPGANQIEIIGSCIFEITATFPRKVGVV